MMQSEQPSVSAARPQQVAAASEPVRTLKKTIYPSVVGKGFLLLARSQTRRWDEALSRVRFEQERVLEQIIRHAEKTEYGRAHDFAGIRNYRDFAARVPVGDYDSFSPFIDRMRKGEKNLLVPEFVRWFGNSSGTSSGGKQKFLPITERQVAIQRKAGTDAVQGRNHLFELFSQTGRGASHEYSSLKRDGSSTLHLACLCDSTVPSARI